MKFLLISPKNRTVWNFRGDLIKTVIDSGYEVVVTGPDQTDVDKIIELGARFIEIPANKASTNVFSDIKYCNKLTKLMKEEKPDVILAYTIKPVIYGAIAAKLANVKHSYGMITGCGYTFTNETLRAKIIGFIVQILFRISLKYLDGVIFQNKDDLNEFVSKKLVDPKKCNVVNGSGVNLNKFSSQPYPDKISFLMVSRLIKSKGVCEYLEAAEKIKSKYPNVKFGILGNYEYNRKDAVLSLYIENFINRGIVERYEETDKVLDYYRKCSVYVLPSNYREGVPRTILEAMACARPIITTDTNGCRETVIEGKNGFLVSTKDVDAVADAMMKYIEHPEKIKEMGNESRKYCEEKYDVIKVNRDMINIMHL